MKYAQYYIEVVERKTRKVIKRLGPHPDRKAERVERGVNLNLNTDCYYTQQVLEN